MRFGGLVVCSAQCAVVVVLSGRGDRTGPAPTTESRSAAEDGARVRDRGRAGSTVGMTFGVYIPGEWQVAR